MQRPYRVRVTIAPLPGTWYQVRSTTAPCVYTVQQSCNMSHTHFYASTVHALCSHMFTQRFCESENMKTHVSTCCAYNNSSNCRFYSAFLEAHFAPYSYVPYESMKVLWLLHTFWFDWTHESHDHIYYQYTVPYQYRARIMLPFNAHNRYQHMNSIWCSGSVTTTITTDASSQIEQNNDKHDHMIKSARF